MGDIAVVNAVWGWKLTDLYGTIGQLDSLQTYMFMFGRLDQIVAEVEDSIAAGPSGAEFGELTASDTPIMEGGYKHLHRLTDFEQWVWLNENVEQAQIMDHLRVVVAYAVSLQRLQQSLIEQLLAKLKLPLESRPLLDVFRPSMNIRSGSECDDSDVLVGVDLYSLVETWKNSYPQALLFEAAGARLHTWVT